MELLWYIPLGVIVLVFIIITAIIVFTVYRQRKYGAFCCFTPKMRYRVSNSEEINGGDFERYDCPSPPPLYDTSRPTIAPPEYCDALQDVLLESGEPNITQNGPSESRFTLMSNIGPPPEYSIAISNSSVQSLPPREEDPSNGEPRENRLSSSRNSLPTTATVVHIDQQIQETVSLQDSVQPNSNV